MPKVKKSREEVPFDNERRQRVWALRAIRTVAAAIGNPHEAEDLLMTIGLRRVRDAQDQRRATEDALTTDAGIEKLIAALDAAREGLLGASMKAAEVVLADHVPIDGVPEGIRAAAAEIRPLIDHVEWVRGIVRRRVRFPGPDWRKAAARLFDETNLSWLAIAVLSRAVVLGANRADGAYPLISREKAKDEANALKQAASQYGRGDGGSW